MKAKIIEASKDFASVRFEKVDAGFMNALRRTIMREVPTLAVDTIEFRSQTSVLYDEVLAHRIGLVPLTTDYSSYEYEDVADDAHSARSMVKLICQAKGPGTVYAESLTSKDPAVKAAQAKMPLVKLMEGQDLEFEASAVMGKGKVHSKWSPGIASYSEAVTITIKNDKPDKAIRERFPKEIFEGASIVAERISTPALVDAVDGVDPSVLEIVRSDDAFIFTAESFGMLPAGEMVLRSIVELRGMLAELRSLVQKG